MNILEAKKCTAHDDFSVCLVNAKLFYHGRKLCVTIRKNVIFSWQSCTIDYLEDTLPPFSSTCGPRS